MFIYHFNRMIRSRILWLIFAIVVGATFLALPSCFSGDSSGREYAGKLGKTKISQNEYATAETFVQRFMGARDLAPAATETQIWAHIAAVRTAKDMGITVTPEELRTVLRSEQAFQENGQFSIDLYTRLVEQSMGITTAAYEKLLADQIIMSKLMQAVSAGSVASPMEIDDEVSARTDTVTFQFASISNKFASAEIDVTDDDLLAYFEKNKADYALPERVGVRYAKIPVTNYFAGVVIEDADIEDYYDANPSQYSRQGTNGVEAIPLEEVRDSIYRELALQDAASVALTNLNDFIESLTTNDLETYTWRCKARFGTAAVDTPLFAADAKFIPGVEREAVEDFCDTAHDLDAESPSGRYGVATGKEYVYLLRATTNDLAHTPAFDTLKNTIRPLCISQKRREKFDAFAEETANAITAAMKESKSFEDAAKDQALNVSTSITFSAQSVAPSAFENARAIVPEVSRLRVGEVSKPIEIYNGAVIACVSARTPCDALAAESQREQLRSMMSSMNGAAAFSDWLIANLERVGFTSSRLALLQAAETETAEEDEE